MPAWQTAGLPAKLGTETTSWSASTPKDQRRPPKFSLSSPLRCRTTRRLPGVVRFSPFALFKDAGRSALSTKFEASALPRACDVGYPGDRVALQAGNDRFDRTGRTEGRNGKARK